MLYEIEKYVRENFTHITNPEEIAKLIHFHIVDTAVFEYIRDYGRGKEE